MNITPVTKPVPNKCLLWSQAIQGHPSDIMLHPGLPGRRLLEYRVGGDYPDKELSLIIG